MQNLNQRTLGGFAQPESTLESSVEVARGRKFNRGTDTRGWRSGSLDERTTMSRGGEDSAGERVLPLGSSSSGGFLYWHVAAQTRAVIRCEHEASFHALLLHDGVKLYTTVVFRMVKTLQSVSTTYYTIIQHNAHTPATTVVQQY